MFQYAYIFAVFFMNSQGSPPQLQAPAETKEECVALVNKSLKENKDYWESEVAHARGAVPVCLKIELPTTNL